jgi:hypothetical protein
MMVFTYRQFTDEQGGVAAYAFWQFFLGWHFVFAEEGVRVEQKRKQKIV